MVSCGEQGESTWLLEAVEVPCNATTRLEYDRSLKGIAGVVLALSVDGNTVRGGRAAVTWAYRGLCCRDLQLEGPLAGIFQTAGAVARDWTAALPEPVSDHLASGKYRRRIIEVQLRRALERAARANRV
jgi:CO/xanthine dehydrogenase FAD-binding subunit